MVINDGHLQLSESDFWKRYFQSKLFHSHRASIRSSATQHVVKDDPIFDKYVEKEDNGLYTLSPIFTISSDRVPNCIELEPRRQTDGDVEFLIDLSATQEDHMDVRKFLIVCFCL